MPAASEKKKSFSEPPGDASAALFSSIEAASGAYRAALSLIAHELRSPAAVVSGYLRMLLQDDLSGLTDRQRRMLDQAGVACGRVLRIIQDLGDLAAVESGELVRSLSVPVFSLCEQAMASAVADVTASAPALTCAEADRGAMVKGDAAWLKRAFTALVAATARERGGPELECCGFVHGVAGARRAVIAVGRPGLTSKRDELVTSRRAFDRWRGGTGLSLPIACRVIEAHDGSVWATESADLQPACVWALPVAE